MEKYLIHQCFNSVVLSGARDAGCFREVAALHSDHLRQVPLYYECMYIPSVAD